MFKQITKASIPAFAWKNTLQDANDDKLLFVHVFHRHGDRTPATLLRINDRNKEHQLWTNKISKQYSSLRYINKDNSNSENDELNFLINPQSNINNLSELYQWNNISNKLNGTYIVHKKDNYDS